jgi:phage-related protein
MANILGLAMKVTADASSVPKSLTQAERALNSLQAQVDRATKVFAPFTESSAGAARAQEQFAERFARLADQLQSKAVGPQEYAAAFAQLTEEAQQAADAFERGIEITQRYTTAEEDRAAQLREIADLVERGAITEQTAARARAELSGDAARLAEEEKKIAAARAEAARVTAANMTPMELYDQEVQQLTAHLAAGRINQETFDRAVAKATQTFTKAETAAKGYDKTVGDVGLKFNELSGVLSAIPGPIGNFAGRLSGLASAGEGLGRVFSGGLSSGLASIGTSLASVVNPATLAAAGIAGIGAAAAAVVSGLSSLEAETERLQNAADKLGVSFNFMQTLQKAAEMSGVSFDTVNGAMTRLLKTLAGADEESKQATAALGRLGVSLTDLEGLDSEQQLKLIGERLQGIEDPAKRAAAATAIFGKSGAELLPFFNNLGTAEQTLNRFNARLSEIDVGRVLALGDSFDAVKASLSGVGNELLTPFIGITQSLSDGLASAIATFGRNIGAVLDIFSPLTSAIGLAGNVLLQFGSTIGNLIGTVLEPFAAQGRLISGVIDAMSQAVTAVAGRINDAIIGFREFFKFEGVAGSFRDTFAQIGEVVSRVATIAEAAFARLGSIIGDTLGRAATVVGEAVSQFLEFTGVGSVISGFAETVGAAFGGLWDAIKNVVGQVGGFIERVLQFAEEWLGIVPEIEQPVVATVEVNGGGAIEELVAESKTLQKTLDDITGSVSTAINESAQFGQAGFDAALKYQTAVDDLKAKLDAGLFNEETFRREAEKAGAAFKDELARLEEDAKLEIQINAEAEKTLAGLQDKINKAVEGAQQFGQSGFDAAAQFQDKLRDLGAQFEDGRINAATLAQEVAKATGEYDKQIEGFKQIDELQKRTLENEKNRVAELLKAGDTTTQLERDIEVVDRERLRLEQEIRTQREAGNVIAADAAAAKLAQLDQLQAKLDTQQQAVEQGFGDGFTKAFEATNKSIDGLIGKAEQFGNVGALAAQALEQGIAKAQQQAQDGILTAETYQKEVERQQDLFNQRLAAAQRVEDFLASKIDERQKAELEAVKQLEERKKQAAVNIQALEARIQTEQKAIEEARDKGRLKDARAGVERVKQLEQAKRIEQGIVDGRVQANRQQAQQLQQGSSAAQQFQSLVARQNDAFLSGFQNAYAGANAALAQSARVAEEQARRMEALTRPTNATVNVADIRTAEGQALVQDVAAQAQDPALIEARLQTRLLNSIAAGITGASANYFNQPVAIVGAARMG